jgi:asparagine synthase (glutamine-hydrolysing)
MKGYLPEQILHKKKWGFTVNPYLQFKKDLKQTAEMILTETFVKNQGIFNYGYIRRILDAKPHPRMRWHYNYLWVVMGLAIWQRMFIDNPITSKEQNIIQTN